jgi:hypothetical protein
LRRKRERERGVSLLSKGLDKRASLQMDSLKRAFFSSHPEFSLLLFHLKRPHLQALLK